MHLPKTLAELSLAYFDEQYASKDLERQFWDFSSGVGIFPKGVLDGKEVITFSSNDYLGLATNEKFVSQAIEVVKIRGVGSGGSHNLGGRYPELSELEHQIASVYERDGSVIFGSGYDANMETLKMLAKIYDNKLVFVSDQLNHRSIIEGMRGLPKAIFTHNDMEDLERELKKVKTTYPNSKPIIVFEGIYSMDGAMPNIRDIVELAKKYDALTIDDEVHAVGLYGSRGGGICESSGVRDDIDIIIGGFGKAHGSKGGFVIADKAFTTAMKMSPSYIFTSTEPPIITSTALFTSKYLMDENCPERVSHRENVAFAKQVFTKKKLPFLDFGGHIIPIMIGDKKEGINDATEAKAVAQDLLEKGYLCRPVFHPSVPIGEARLRIIVNASHTKEHIHGLAEALEQVLSKHNIIGKREGIALCTEFFCFAEKQILKKQNEKH